MGKIPPVLTVQHGPPGRGRASVAPLAGLSAPVVDDEPEFAPPEAFDPSEHTVVDVQSYVDDGHTDEIDAILTAERAGQNRVTLVEWLETHEG